jgi:cobalt/nickel transport protein
VTTTDAGPAGSRPRGGTARWWLAGLAIATAVVIVLAPFASPSPDGLERVAADANFFQKAQAAIYQLLPDYRIPGVDDAIVSTIIAGLLGVYLVFGLMWLLGRFLVRRDDHAAAGVDGPDDAAASPGAETPAPRG